MTRRRVLMTVCVWAVLVVLLWISNSDPAVHVLGGIVAVAAAITFATLDLTKSVLRVSWTRRSDQPDRSDGTDARVSAVRHQVYRARLSGSAEISETLVDLLDSRLVARHQIQRAAEPANADALLTPSLRRLVAGPRRQTATVRELRQILTDIEAL